MEVHRSCPAFQYRPKAFQKNSNDLHLYKHGLLLFVENMQIVKSKEAQNQIVVFMNSNSSYLNLHVKKVVITAVTFCMSKISKLSEN